MKTADDSNQAVFEPAAPAVGGFTRDRLTWIGYFLFGYWSFVWGAFGAFVPFIRSDMHLSASEAALHFSALAIGPILAGFTGNFIISRAGQRTVILSGTGAVVAGTVIVVFGKVLSATVFGAWLIGFGGCLMGQAIITSMSSRFGSQRALGISECNIASSVFSLLAPIAIGLSAKVGIDWKGTLLCSLGMFVAILLPNFKAFSPITRQIQDATPANSDARLTATYWMFFAIIFLSVASEWSVAFWCTEFTSETLHLSKNDAAISMTAFLLGMFVGRIIGTRLLNRFSISRLLPLSAWMALSGFLLFWLGHNLTLNLLGLLIMGLGESNIYPLSLSEAIGSVSKHSTKATTRMSLSTGSAILIAPLLLGLLTDRVGINRSYALVAIFLLFAAAAIQITKRHRSAIS